mmetsp:Transcript_36686/g.92725  ORF Transcript_36686/g.92725 Transcript_36686/m.92725 type:complete len:83 (+) Transcript_36686:60-308(+)
MPMTPVCYVRPHFMYFPFQVETLLIPKPTDENTSGLGKVIIKYTSSFDAGKAKAAMHGRRFGGKTVEAVYISEANYSAGVLQ